MALPQTCPSSSEADRNDISFCCICESNFNRLPSLIANHKNIVNNKTQSFPLSPLETATGSERSDFFTEIDTMKMVAEGNNPHVVNMVGCVTLQEPICLVTEFVKYGDLLSYLTTIRRLVS